MQACGLSCCPSRLSLRFTFTFYTLLAPGDLTYPDVSHPISPRGYRVSRRQGAQKKTDSTRSSILVYFFRSFILFRGISNIMDSVTRLNILMKPTFLQFFFFLHVHFCDALGKCHESMSEHIFAGFRPMGLFATFFILFLVSSGGWVKIKLKFPSFHVSDKCFASI